MEYKNLVKDFTERTNHNLKIIERHEGDSYEVTQLINSLLGLLVLPQQSFFNSIPSDSIEKAKSDGWLIPNPIDGYDQVDNLSKYLRYLRNGISHFNIEFISDNGIISGIKIWNKPQGSKVNWKIKLKIEEIKSITNKINELIHNI